MDSFRRPVFQRFVSWICFVRPKISKDSIRFVSEGFVYESRILNNNSMRLAPLCLFQALSQASHARCAVKKTDSAESRPIQMSVESALMENGISNVKASQSPALSPVQNYVLAGKVKIKPECLDS